MHRSLKNLPWIAPHGTLAVSDVGSGCMMAMKLMGGSNSAAAGFFGLRLKRKTLSRTCGVTRRTATSSRRSTVATIICSWLTMASLSFMSSIAFFLMDFLLLGSATHVGFWLRLRRTHRLMRLRVRCEYDT